MAGVILLLPGLACGYFTFVFSTNTNFYDEFAITLLSIGLLFIGFSQLRAEDEATRKIRLNAIYWAILLDVFCVAVLWLILLANDYINIPILDKVAQLSADLYNWLFVLVIFVCRFYYLLNKYRTRGIVNPTSLIPFNPYNLIGKATALVLCVLTAVAAIFNLKNDIYADLFSLIPAAFFLLIGSKERNETEEISNIRLNAMQVAVYINYILVLVATWTVYGLDYLVVLLISLISIPIIFALIFYATCFKASRQNRKIALGSS